MVIKLTRVLIIIHQNMHEHTVILWHKRAAFLLGEVKVDAFSVYTLALQSRRTPDTGTLLKRVYGNTTVEPTMTFFLSYSAVGKVARPAVGERSGDGCAPILFRQRR